MSANSKDGRKPNDYILHELALLPNEKQAMALMKAHAARECDVEFGADLIAAKQAFAHTEARFTSGNDDLSKLEKRLRNTDQLVPSRKPETSEDAEPERWKHYDFWQFWVAIFGGIAAVGMGALNLNFAMRTSFSPIFIESPFLAWGLAMLLPLGSLALKFASDYLPTNSSRRRYELSVFLINGGALGVWAYLFAQAYPGVAVQIEFDVLLSGSHGGSSLVLTQLLVELLTGSSLWIAASGIYRRYQPDMLDDNPQYIALTRTVKAQRGLVKELSDAYGICRGKVARLEAQRDLYINKRCIRLAALRRYM